MCLRGLWAQFCCLLLPLLSSLNYGVEQIGTTRNDSDHCASTAHLGSASSRSGSGSCIFVIQENRKSPFWVAKPWKDRESPFHCLHGTGREWERGVRSDRAGPKLTRPYQVQARSSPPLCPVPPLCQVGPGHPRIRSDRTRSSPALPGPRAQSVRVGSDRTGLGPGPGPGALGLVRHRLSTGPGQNRLDPTRSGLGPAHHCVGCHHCVESDRVGTASGRMGPGPDPVPRLQLQVWTFVGAFLSSWLFSSLFLGSPPAELIPDSCTWILAPSPWSRCCIFPPISF